MIHKCYVKNFYCITFVIIYCWRWKCSIAISMLKIQFHKLLLLLLPNYYQIYLPWNDFKWRRRNRHDFLRGEYITDIAIRTFSSSATSYYKEIEIPKLHSVSPSNRQTFAISHDQIGLYGQIVRIFKFHGLLLSTPYFYMW